MIVQAWPVVTGCSEVTTREVPRPAPIPIMGSRTAACAELTSMRTSPAIPSQMPYSDDQSASRPRPSLADADSLIVSAGAGGGRGLAEDLAAQTNDGVGPGCARVAAQGADLLEAVAAAGAQDALERGVGARRGRRRGRCGLGRERLHRLRGQGLAALDGDLGDARLGLRAGGQGRGGDGGEREHPPAAALHGLIVT